MDIFNKISSETAKQNYGSASVGPVRNTPNNPVPKNTPKEKTSKPSEDVVTLSQNAKSTVDESSQKSEGSFVISNNRVSFRVTENNDLVVKIVDKDTKEVVREIPPEEMVKIKEALEKALAESAEGINI